MSIPASKRRKLEHTASDDEGDVESFASFGESQGEDGEEDEILGDGDLESMNDAGEDSGDESVESEDYAVEEPKKPGNTSQQRKDARRKNARAIPASTSPYVAGNHKSSMFKLQVDELLEQIRPRHGKKEKEAEYALHKLKTAIENIPEKGPSPVADAERELFKTSKVAVPFPDPRPPKDAKYKFEYAKPTNINVVGSHVLRTASRSRKTIEIDMVVTMPASMFQEKDYLNYRYFYKRAYYIAYIAAGLKDIAAKDYKVSFCNFHDDPLKPILIVTPDASSTDSTPHRWRVNIIPCIPDNTFQAEKLSLDKSCIRNQASQPGENGSDVRVATPFYNSSLRSDVLMTSYLKLLHGTSKTCEAFTDACLLGNTWLRQRGFGSDIHAGGFGNFECSALVALLLQGGGPGGKPMLSGGYSSYQLFKATIQLLAMKNFSKQPLVIDSTGEPTKLSAGKSPVIWDAMRSHNILFKMSPWSYKLLQLEARRTHITLGDTQSDGFDSTFILRTDGFLYRYDFVMELDAETLAATTEEAGSAANKLQKLYEILQQALEDRVECINITPSSLRTWNLQSTNSNQTPAQKLMVGFMINSIAAARTVDHGPSAEEKSKAAAFRKFWGEKAELRRFRDGSIQETLVWSGKENSPSVVVQILRYVVQRQFGDEAEQSMTVIGDALRKILPQGGSNTIFQPFMDAYKQLETDIRSLDGLPLVVRQIMPADSQLRFASIKPPGQGQNINPADVTIQFEGSTRWPDDLVAIHRTKIAFLLKLRGQLLESVDSVTARLGLENEAHDIMNQGFLDIIYDSGAAFRLRIHHDREQTLLLDRKLKDKTIDPKSKDIAVQALATYRRDYIKAPAHTQATAKLCSLHPALSGTIRLLKKWLASHLLSNHIADEVIDLLAARTFMQPAPWQTPESVQTGFLRTLFWLSRWDWKAEPLIVDFSGSSDLDATKVKSINLKFEAWRKLDPAMNRVVLFAASNVDDEGTTWTDGRPAKVVAGRMTSLARAACAEVEEKGLRLVPSSLFESSLSDFDFVIHIDPKAIGKKSSRKSSGTNGIAFKNLELDLIDDTSRVGLDTFGSFLNEIEELYSSAILFFSGRHEKPIIAGLWNPQTARRAWKLNLAYSTLPVKDGGKEEVQAEVNKEAILAEIARLGGDIIKGIEVKSRG